MCEVNSNLELLEDLYSKYLQVSDEMKVKLLKTLLSNCTLKDGKVSYTYKKPFCYIAETDCVEKIYPRAICLARSRLTAIPRFANVFSTQPQKRSSLSSLAPNAKSVYSFLKANKNRTRINPCPIYIYPRCDSNA